MHGFTHIAEDPVPSASCDSPGLMSADDKCKLDAFLQTRVGVLGWAGAGMPDDGGYMVGDIIFAAGNEFISLERIGNTIRVSGEFPIPFACSEACAQIFWVEDSSEPRAIRPPSCNGLMPDLTAYGQLKVYSLPESTIVDPNNPMKVLSTKGQYPVLAFTRYQSGLTPFENEYQLILKRNSDYTANVGWAFTPGPLGVAQNVWFMGKDQSGVQMKFEMWPEIETGLLGALLFNGNLITKKPAVITDYTPTVLNDNRYVLKLWDMKKAVAVGNSFISRNVWRYINPENTTTQTNPQTLALDSSASLLPIGSLVDIYEYEISRNANQRITRSYFIKEPNLNPAHLWMPTGIIRFGDLFTARDEINPISGTAINASEINVSDIRLLERKYWGLTGFEDRLILSDDGGAGTDSSGNKAYEPSGEPINNDLVADIDPTIPGLRVLVQTKPPIPDLDNDGTLTEADLRIFACHYGAKEGQPNYLPEADFNKDGVIDIRDLAIIGQYFDLSVEKVVDRPLFLWHRPNHKNVIVKAKIGMPDIDARSFPPIDFLLDAPVDSFDDTYLKVLKRGVFTTGPFAGSPYVVVKGLPWDRMTQQGVIRILTGAFRHTIWRYYFKAGFSNWDDDGIVLIGRDIIFPLDEDFPIDQYRKAGSSGTECTGDNITGAGSTEIPVNTTVVELLHQDYSAPCCRLNFDVNYQPDDQAVQLQIFVGMLDMSIPYPFNDLSLNDDLVRGFSPGFTVSKIMVQNGFILDGIGADVKSTPEGFRCYKGGELAVPVQGQTEKWNDVEIMFRDGQVWVWHNSLLVPPDPATASKTPNAAVVNTPYFPLRPMIDSGKVALRMFPGAIVRSMEVQDQLRAFSEYTNGGLELTS
jgi:hypothetical protein